MRRKNTLFFLLLVEILLGLLVACSAQIDTNQATGRSNPENSDQAGRIHADLAQGVTLHDVSDQLADEGVTRFTARIRYTEHETYLQIGEEFGDVEQVLAAERARLVFLRDQFSESDSLEAPIKKRFALDIEAIDATMDLAVRWVEYGGEKVNLGDLAARQAPIEAPDAEEVAPNPDGIGTVQQALTDWTGDQIFTPAGGTSTIYTSGTLQKFWLDTDARNIIDHFTDGLEIDTVIKPRSAATCNTSGVSSNLPAYYADTEAFDFGERNCSVGTIDGDSLQAWYLYWTWHPFGSFNTSAHIDVQYQPKSWCWWTSSSTDCANNPPWCMCEHYMYNDTSWLISYDYSEAPGVEKSWVKN